LRSVADLKIGGTIFRPPEVDDPRDMTAHFDCHIVLPTGEDLRANAETTTLWVGVTNLGIARFESEDLCPQIILWSTTKGSPHGGCRSYSGSRCGRAGGVTTGSSRP